METFRCLLDTPGLRVSYDPVNECLYNQWFGEHTPSSILAGAEMIAQCLAKQPCAKILSDHSELWGDWLAAAPQVGAKGLAQLAAQGIVYFAWVYPPCYTGRLAIYHARLHTTALASSLFDNLAEACEWLQGLPEPVGGQAPHTTGYH